MAKLNEHQSGFTIVELLIATTIFSIVLTVIVFAVIFVSDSFVKGGIESQTQETARSIEQQVSQQIQLSGGTVTTSAGLVCVGDYRYSYTLNQEVDSSGSGGLVAQNIPNGCTSTNVPTAGRAQLLGDHMRLGNFGVNSLGNGLYSISLTIAYGDDTTQGGALSVLSSNPYTYQCDPSVIFGRFCTVDSLSTVVQQRVQ